MVARVRPSLDPFQCGRPEIYSGMGPIMAHLHACHNLLDACATSPRPAPFVPSAGAASAVLDVRGKTVVVYIESGFADQPRFPPAKTFATFLRYAREMLAALRFSG
jgi:hypothetical protein